MIKNTTLKFNQYFTDEMELKQLAKMANVNHCRRK